MPENDANSELKGLIETVIKTVGGLASDIRSNSYKLDRLESRFEGLETKFGDLETRFEGLETRFEGLETGFQSLTSEVRVLSAQFNDVGVMAIADNGRITDVEKRVEVLEAGTH